MDNKQKGMLGVLLVLLLGMGGWYVFLSGDAEQAKAKDGPVAQKRTRVQKENTTVKRQRRKGRKTETKTVEKRERKSVERKTVEKRRKKGRRKGKEKKKEILPAA